MKLSRRTFLGSAAASAVALVMPKLPQWDAPPPAPENRRLAPAPRPMYPAGYAIRAMTATVGEVGERAPIVSLTRDGKALATMAVDRNTRMDFHSPIYVDGGELRIKVEGHQSSNLTVSLDAVDDGQRLVKTWTMPGKVGSVTSRPMPR